MLTLGGEGGVGSEWKFINTSQTLCLANTWTSLEIFASAMDVIKVIIKIWLCRDIFAIHHFDQDHVNLHFLQYLKLVSQFF